MNAASDAMARRLRAFAVGDSLARHFPATPAPLRRLQAALLVEPHVPPDALLISADALMEAATEARFDPDQFPLAENLTVLASLLRGVAADCGKAREFAT